MTVRASRCFPLSTRLPRRSPHRRAGFARGYWTDVSSRDGTKRSTTRVHLSALHCERLTEAQAYDIKNAATGFFATRERGGLGAALFSWGVDALFTDRLTCSSKIH